MGEEQAALLRRLAGVVGFEQGLVLGRPGCGEAVTALFDPAVEVGLGDAVGPGEQGRVGRENGDGRGLIDYVVGVVSAGVGDGDGVGSFGRTETGVVVL